MTDAPIRVTPLTYGWVRAGVEVSVTEVGGAYHVHMWQRGVEVGWVRVEAAPRRWVEAVSLFAPGGAMEGA